MYEWDMLHIQMSHVSCTNGSCGVRSHVQMGSGLTYKWVMSHTYEWVMSHTYEWVRSHTHEWVMSHTHEWVVKCHIRMSHVSRTNASHLQMGHEQLIHVARTNGSHKNESCLTYMSHIQMGHIRMSHVSHVDLGVKVVLAGRHGKLWLGGMLWLRGKASHAYGWVMCHIRIIRISHVSHPNGLHTNESCLTYEWVMSYIEISRVSHTNESCLTYEWVMSHIWISRVSHTNESCLTYE